VVTRYFDKTRPDAAPGETTREDIYPSLSFPRGVDQPRRRPYTGINMVSTADGKVVVGGPGTTHLIGGDTDHYLMARIDGQADALLFGAGLIRDDNPRYPRHSEEWREWRRSLGLRPDALWGVVSTRGEFPEKPRMFGTERENTAVFTTSLVKNERRQQLEEWSRVFICGETAVDPVILGQTLRDELGIRSMICLGGPTLNAALIEAGVLDELFLTLAPKLQGGRGVPTAVEGKGFPADHLQQLDLLSLYGDGGELYLRYRFTRP
jgi:2,5-diamino-6-(ribosylamino)-4(3H)-pyrimidinone 5'-phosphate reductase